MTGLRFHEWGRAGSPTIVAVHGLEDGAAGWRPFADAVSSDYHVVAPDIRGHGDSDASVTGAYGVRDHAAGLASLISGMGLGTVVLVGHSEGGAVAVLYAAQHPERVDALVAVGTDPRSGGPLADAYDPMPGGWSSTHQVAAYLHTRQPGSTDQAVLQQAADLTRELPGGRLTWRRDPDVVAAYHQPDLWPQWRSLSCPALVVRGRRSAVLSHETAVTMREQGRRVRLAELEGGGHWIHQEFPGAFEATVRWFLDSPPQ